MLISLVILLLILLIVSVVLNFLLLKAGERQLVINELYISWISEWRIQVLKTWAHMKMLDDKQMFEKDDEVGIVFQDMKDLIQNLNNRTEETIEEEGE
jgi:hypothetical protein